ncbi:hypothetical protein ES705_01646 [subsurface metagenome]|nr:hypothetical protein [Clostridia bacterium]
MEKRLVALEEELNDLYKYIEGDVWGQLHKWEKEFWNSPDINKSKYDWCKEEFEKIKGREILKDSFRERISSYKKLFEKIKSIE